MNYPVTLSSFENGLSLLIPDPEKVKSTFEQLRIKDPNTPFPFWAQVWPSAIALSSFLQEEPQLIEGRRILELGAGIGLPSFAISKFASEMVISDHSLEAVELMEMNIHQLNLKHAKAICLDWNHLSEDIETDVLILSDINYDPEQFGPLLKMINRFLVQGTTVILSSPQRITITPFAEAIKPFIQHSELIVVPHLQTEVEIRILVLQQN
jgi:predicted nicotinamide N-methyase